MKTRDALIRMARWKGKGGRGKMEGERWKGKGGREKND
jgi:hypothetical protein